MHIPTSYSSGLQSLKENNDTIVSTKFNVIYMFSRVAFKTAVLIKEKMFFRLSGANSKSTAINEKKEISRSI